MRKGRAMLGAVLAALLVGMMGGPALAQASPNGLDQVLSVDYDADNNIFVVVGVAGGQIDVYYGSHNNWTKLQENRDIDNRYSPSEFVDFAIGEQEGAPGDDYGVAVGNKGGQATSINVREFSDKPYFGDGRPRPIGDLDSVLSVDYDADNNIFVVVGVAGGQIDVYYGSHNNWTKLQENRDIDNRYSPSEFVDFAIGEQEGAPGDDYGVAVGNNEDAGGNAENGGTSINVREFSDKPYFGDGVPQRIGG